LNVWVVSKIENFGDSYEMDWRTRILKACGSEAEAVAVIYKDGAVQQRLTESGSGYVIDIQFGGQYSITRTTMDDPESEIEIQQFVHDCDACTFLGRANDTDGDSHDLYFHIDGNYITVIARYGNAGPQYTSGWNSINPILIEAQRRAVEKGLV